MSVVAIPEGNQCIPLLLMVERILDELLSIHMDCHSLCLQFHHPPSLCSPSLVPDYRFVFKTVKMGCSTTSFRWCLVTPLVTEV